MILDHKSVPKLDKKAQWGARYLIGWGLGWNGDDALLDLSVGLI